MKDKIFEFIYTRIFSNPLLKRILNAAILITIPKIITRHGVKLALNPSDPVISGSLFFGVYENQELNLIKKYAKNGFRFIDIGANIGLYSAIIASIIGEKGSIYSFEPEPKAFKFLQNTINLNNFKNIHAFQKAASDSEGEIFLYASENNGGDNRAYDLGKESIGFNKVTVKKIHTGNFLLSQGINSADLIKIDVQGYEFYVFQGLIDLINNSKKIAIFTEFWPAGLMLAKSDPRDLLNLFLELKLDILDIKTQTRYTYLSLENILMKYKGREYTNLILTKGY